MGVGHHRVVFTNERDSKYKGLRGLNRRSLDVCLRVTFRLKFKLLY